MIVGPQEEVADDRNQSVGALEHHGMSARQFRVAAVRDPAGQVAAPGGRDEVVTGQAHDQGRRHHPGQPLANVSVY